MKRIASAAATLALAATAVLGSAVTARAADVSTFSHTSQSYNTLGTVTTLTYTGTFACYSELRHRTQTLDGKLIVWLEGKHIDGMCIQVISKHTVSLTVRPGQQVVSLAETLPELVEA